MPKRQTKTRLATVLLSDGLNYICMGLFDLSKQYWFILYSRVKIRIERSNTFWQTITQKLKQTTTTNTPFCSGFAFKMNDSSNYGLRTLFKGPTEATWQM